MSRNLSFGGCDVVALANQYGTPLYVMDEGRIRLQMRSFKRAFDTTGLDYRVAYAGKAFLTLAMCKVVEDEGFMLNVASGGELYTALQAGFPAERIYFHGNNKSIYELEEAIQAGIEMIVVDNFNELTILQNVAHQHGKVVRVLLRITPGISAHTHVYIQTAQEDTKFGFDLASGQAAEAVKLVQESSDLELLGFHCHIGSQIFETKAFVVAVEKMATFIHYCREQFHLHTQVLNLGGGFGIRYSRTDSPKPISEYADQIADAVKKAFPQGNYPQIWVEPGRRIVGEAGITLYTVGTIKEIPGLRKYVVVDGGMTDNPCPTLYQTKYEAVVANRVDEPATETVSVAGRCGESGDMLMWDVKLPVIQSGDLLAVYSTGAYHYSMANNYHRLPRPAVVFVYEGKAELVVRRETYQDLVRFEQIPTRLQK